MTEQFMEYDALACLRGNGADEFFVKGGVDFEAFVPMNKT
jgi:hypothetical protein